MPRPEQSLHGPDSAFGGPVAGGQSYAREQVSDALVSHELVEFYACVTGPALVLDGLDLQRLDLLDDSSQRLQRILIVIGGEWLNPEVLCPQIDHHDKMRVGSPGLERLMIGAECSCIDCQALKWPLLRMARLLDTCAGGLVELIALISEQSSFCIFAGDAQCHLLSALKKAR